jgi:TonB family protein
MNNTEAWKTWEGRTVDGKFPLRRWLGGSDHSAVFLTDLGGAQKAVIKLIAASLNADRQLSRWAAAAKLSHPHLLRLFEMGRCRFDGTPLLYLVVEYAEEDLSQIIPQRPLAPAEVGDMLPPVLDALSYIHSKGFVHTRLRPSNIAAVADQLKLSTDGVSPRGESDEKPASLGIYDAPEAASGEIYPAIDVWSLGVTLVVALTQNPPAKDASGQKDPVVPDTVPEPFRSIARESLHRQVKQRCTVADIKAWRPPQQPPPSAPLATPDAPTKSSGSKWLIGGAVTLALLVVAVLIGQKIFAHHGETPAQIATHGEPDSPAVTSPPGSPSKPPASTPTASSSDGTVLRQVLPEVPQSARNTITGKLKVVARVEVDPSGKVTDATLTKPGPSKYFARLALAASQKWEFAPPQTGGQATSSAWILRFEFSRTSTKAFPSRESARH